MGCASKTQKHQNKYHSYLLRNRTKALAHEFYILHESTAAIQAGGEKRTKSAPSSNRKTSRRSRRRKKSSEIAPKKGKDQGERNGETLPKRKRKNRSGFSKKRKRVPVLRLKKTYSGTKSREGKVPVGMRSFGHLEI